MLWRERILEARARGAFTHADHELARDWTTCAVGEQSARYAHLMLQHLDPMCEEEGLPLLVSLGARFAEAVCQGCEEWARPSPDSFSCAERLLDAIEDRALAVKQAMEQDHA